MTRMTITWSVVAAVLTISAGVLAWMNRLQPYPCSMIQGIEIKPNAQGLKELRFSFSLESAYSPVLVQYERSPDQNRIFVTLYRKLATPLFRNFNPTPITNDRVRQTSPFWSPTEGVMKSLVHTFDLTGPIFILRCEGEEREIPIRTDP